MNGAGGRGLRFGLFIVPLAILALLLISGTTPAAVNSHVSAQPQAVSTGTDSSTYLYFNGTVKGNGGLQTLDLPTPSNGTVWDLVSASITITAASRVSTIQNSDLYDSTCTQLDVAPAASNCKGIYGPNVDTLVNDVLTDGESGTNTGSGGYSATEPPGLVQYFHWWQTIHMTYDTFWSFEWDLSNGVSSTYRVVMDPEIGDYPSYAFYRWGSPVGPLSSTPKTVTIPGPPTGYVYRGEMAVSTIDLGNSRLTPSRSAEIIEEPSGTVLTHIDSWTLAGPGVTEDACGGYSSGQSCPSDPTGMGTVWDSQVLVTSSESLEAKFVGVSGDTGVFAVVVTEYPADPALVAHTPKANHNPAYVGQTVTFSVAKSSGGTGPYNYAWNGLPGGCHSANALTIACKLTAPTGTFHISVTVTDANGTAVTSHTFSFKVEKAPAQPIPIEDRLTIGALRSVQLDGFARATAG